ncbi:MAG: hypothetical protein STHCBS139747_000613 [Sporothrix thermara]
MAKRHRHKCASKPKRMSLKQMLAVPPAQQDKCPLFSILPAEIRAQIFGYVLSDYPDPSPAKRYEESTCYSRPQYFAPRRTDTALLQTCRAVFAESWFMPLLLREQTHWLCAEDRAPPEYKKVQRVGVEGYLRPILKQMREQHSSLGTGAGAEAGTEAGTETKTETGAETKSPVVDITMDTLRVFAQMYQLEWHKLASLLRVPDLRPRRLIITVRHADWWFWEDDVPLRFEGNWLEKVCEALPSSVREVCIELETASRRRAQLEDIAKQMREKWFFKRQDGVVLLPDVTGRNVVVSQWTGSSTWQGKTWTRDENAPGQIVFHVMAVPFLPEHIVRRGGGGVSETTRDNAEQGVFDNDYLRLQCQAVVS